MPNKDIQMIIHAGIIDSKFRDKLLKQDTRMATISGGYQGEQFDLTQEEREGLDNLGDFETFAKFAEAIEKATPGPGTERRS